MATPARVVATIVAAYVLCPLAIVFMRAMPVVGLAAVVGLALAAVALLLNRRREEMLRRHRSDAGLCVACGYDLRASRGRCPECGERALHALARAP